MKRNLKKVLLALMLSIGVMGAVSVQAQTEKVKVYAGPFTSESNDPNNIFKGSVNEICNQYIAADNEYRASSGYYSQYIGEGAISVSIPGSGGHWTGGRSGGGWLNCPLQAIKKEDKSIAYTSAIGTGVKCETGYMYEYAWDGCYEEKDHCDEGTVNIKGFCVVPCTGIGEDGTASPKGCVPVNAKECDEKRERYKEFLEGSVGFVSCNKEGFDSCSYESSAFKDPEARKYARECTFVHEYTHIINREIYEPLCVVYDDLKDDGIQGYSRERLDIHEMDEKAAYIASARCLLEKRNNCTNQACKDQLGIAAVIHGKEAGLIK